MRKKIVMALMATVITATSFGTTGLVANAEEAPVTTSAATVVKQNLNAEMVAKVFDANYYATTYPDVAAAFGTDANALLNHYMTAGIYEGRNASATFNASFYALANSDLATTLGDNLESYIEHYLTFGAQEGRVASFEQLIALDPAAAANIGASIATTVLSMDSTNMPLFMSSYLNQTAVSWDAMKATIPGITESQEWALTENWTMVRSGFTDFLSQTGMPAGIASVPSIVNAFIGSNGGVNTNQQFGVLFYGDDGKQYNRFYTMDENYNMVDTGVVMSIDEINAHNAWNDHMLARDEAYDPDAAWAAFEAAEAAASAAAAQPRQCAIDEIRSNSAPASTPAPVVESAPVESAPVVESAPAAETVTE